MDVDSGNVDGCGCGNRSSKVNAGPKPCIHQNPSHLSEVSWAQSPKCSRAMALK